MNFLLESIRKPITSMQISTGMQYNLLKNECYEISNELVA